MRWLKHKWIGSDWWCTGAKIHFDALPLSGPIRSTSSSPRLDWIGERRFFPRWHDPYSPTDAVWRLLLMEMGARRKSFVLPMIVLDRKSQLTRIVGALAAARRLSGGLYRWQQQPWQ